jgi:AcrR family transcriptional regulator
LDEKQKLIMDVAQKSFHRQGFEFTSIDEIVKACKISKATFYKYFSTKEDLAYELLAYSNKRFLCSAKAIDGYAEIDPKVRLKNKIIAIWEYILYIRNLNALTVEKYSEVKVERINRLKKIIRNNMLEEYHKSLIAVYGEEIEQIVWELIFTIDGLTHEFILINRFNHREFHRDFVGDYIIRNIDITIDNIKYVSPMIHKSTIYITEENEDNKPHSSEEALFYDTIKKLREHIEKDTTHLRQKKLIQAVNKLEEEANTGSYDSFMMEAMLSYLQNEKTLKAEVAVLNNLKNKLGAV